MFKGKKKYFTILVMTLLLGAILRARDELFQALSHLTLEVFLLLVILQLTTLLTVAWQWKYIIEKGHFAKVSFQEIVKINLGAKFIESITPSTKLGGESAKFYLLNKISNISAVNSVAVMSLQKVTTFSALIIIVLPFISYWPREQEIFSSISPVKAINSYSPEIIIIIILIIVTMIVGGKKSEIDFSPVLLKVKDFFQELGEVLVDKGKPKIIIKASLIAGLYWLLYPVKTYLVAHFTFGNITIGLAIAATLLAYIVSTLPLMPGGLGTFEGTMALVLMGAGFTFNEGLLVALLLRVITFWFPLILSAIITLKLSNEVLQLRED